MRGVISRKIKSNIFTDKTQKGSPFIGTKLLNIIPKPINCKLYQLVLYSFTNLLIIFRERKTFNI